MARRGIDSTLLRAAALGALSGMRSMAAPRVVSRSFAEGPSPSKLRSAEATARLISLAAAGEMLADKSPWIPIRTSALALAGRAILGSLSATAYAHHRDRPLLPHAVVGAAAAVASTFASFHARRLAVQHLQAPDVLIALIEDALVLAAGRALEEAIGRP